MNPLLNELLILNRMIIFIKLLLDEAVNMEIYYPMIRKNLEFLLERFEVLYSMLSDPLLKKYSKIFCTISKKCLVTIEDLLKKDFFLSSCSIDRSFFSAGVNSLKDYQESFSRNIHAERKVDSNRNYINASEYTLLFEQLEE